MEIMDLDEETTAEEVRQAVCNFMKADEHQNIRTFPYVRWY